MSAKMEGLPREILKLVEDHEGDTYRAAFVAVFKECVYLLHVFKKKSATGRATPRPDKATILVRWKAAQKDHQDRYRAMSIGRNTSEERVEVYTCRDNIFEELGLTNAEGLLARVDLAAALTDEIRRRKLTQVQAARFLGVSQSDVSNLMRGKVTGFSQERLGRLLNALDLDVRIEAARKEMRELE